MITANYVYAHSHKGVIFYIGCGNSSRPYNKRCRSDLWKRKVVTLTGFDTRVIFTSDDRKQAHTKEKELIYLIKPECNVNHVSVDPKSIIEPKYKYKLLSISDDAGRKLKELSRYRKANECLIKTQGDIIAELVLKAHKREFKQNPHL